MNPPKMPIHIGDYRRDTGHLRAAQHGAYLMLMFHYWSTGSLPADDEQLASIACMTRAEWRKHKPTLQAFFKEGWKHGRIDYELEKAARISEAAREAGKASGRSRSVDNQLNGRSSSVEPTLLPSNLKEKEDTADAVPTTYAFESGIIKLSEKDFNTWKASFSHLDLSAELVGLSQWAEQQGPAKWFFAVSGALAKRNRTVMAAKKNAEQPFKWNKIEGVV
jgi:uncharacterized protein YdaU (DUF1376 family)